MFGFKKNTHVNWQQFLCGTPSGDYIFQKELSNQDRVKAENLILRGRYVRVLQYMLDNNCKLEQEIISISHRFTSFGLD